MCYHHARDTSAAPVVMATMPSDTSTAGASWSVDEEGVRLQQLVSLDQPFPGETRIEFLRVNLLAVADELRDEIIPGNIRHAIETIRHWRATG